MDIYSPFRAVTPVTPRQNGIEIEVEAVTNASQTGQASLPSIPPKTARNR